MEKATFGAGCFWGVEAAFRELKGVLFTQVGYEGGVTEHPAYQDVCNQGTGHAEVLEVTFDPAQTSYDDLLTLFWGCHDPTQFNRQGPDFGSQYRSVIFCHTMEQEQAAVVSREREDLSGKHRRRIVTEILPASFFWRAEEYHQQYLAKRESVWKGDNL